MAYQMKWKVYGKEGHRQRESFSPSQHYDFSKDGKIRELYVTNADISGTYEYSLITILRDTKKECIHEFAGQISDGVFENSYVGKAELIYEREFEA